MNTAVIGVGNMGRNHARVFSQISNLVAVADINKNRAHEIAKLHNCNYYSNYNDMLEKEKIDAVSIVVPTPLHKEVTTDVMKKGVNAILEKPIASNLNDAMEIFKVVKKSKFKFTVGHVERFNPAVIKFKEILDRGDLGEILGITARRVGGAGSPVTYENIMVDLAIHDIDIINYLLNKKKPDEALCFMGKSTINNTEDYADIILRYGVTNALVQVNWITPIKIRVLSINGSKAYVELNYITQDLRLYKMDFIKEYDNFGKFVLKYSKAEEQDIAIEKDEPLKLELKSFLDCIRNDTRPMITIEESLSALETALKLFKRDRITR